MEQIGKAVWKMNEYDRNIFLSVVGKNASINSELIEILSVMGEYN